MQLMRLSIISPVSYVAQLFLMCINLALWILLIFLFDNLDSLQ